MPVPITKYKCGFKCGHVAMHSFIVAEKHEQQCFRNPANRTCETCSNRVYQIEEDDYDESYSLYIGYRSCKIKIMADFFETMGEKLRAGNGKHMKPVFYCPNHNLVDEVDGIEDFAQRVTMKIEENIKSRDMQAASFLDTKDNLPF